MEILKTGIQNFDKIHNCGFPINSLNFIAGPPGNGKTIFSKTLDEHILYNAINIYDIVINLYTPNWGEMEYSGLGTRAIQVRKARGSIADAMLYHYIIRPGGGIIIQRNLFKR